MSILKIKNIQISDVLDFMFLILLDRENKHKKRMN